MANDENKRAKPKRRLKNPETIREQALKARESEGRPKRTAKVRSSTKKAFSPLKKAGKPFKKKPFRWIGLVIVPPFLRRSWAELRLVTWPNRRESRQLTTAVVIFSIVFGVVVAIADWGLDKLFKEVIIK